MTFACLRCVSGPSITSKSGILLQPSGSSSLLAEHCSLVCECVERWPASRHDWMGIYSRDRRSPSEGTGVSGWLSLDLTITMLLCFLQAEQPMTRSGEQNSSYELERTETVSVVVKSWIMSTVDTATLRKAHCKRNECPTLTAYQNGDNAIV